MKNSIKTTILSIVLLVCFVGVSCSSCNADVIGSSNYSNDSDSVSKDATLTGTYSSSIDGWITDEDARATVTPSADQMPSTYNAEDFVYDAVEYTQVEIDLSNLGSSYANGDITVEAKAKKTTITLGNAAKYNIVLSGASEVGVTIVSDYDFVLTLDNVSISSKDGSDEQALKTKGSATCFVVLVGESTLAGCTDESGETSTNAVKVGGSLVISGDGVLNVVGNTKHGIVSDDVVCIQSGTVNVTLNPDTSAGTGIKTVNGYVQNSGVVNITALNMAEGCETKGIKVDGDEEETEYGAGKGYIIINGGELTINTSGKGMSAGFNPTEDGDTSSSVNDPSADVFINNGLITITTYATPREDTYTNGVCNDDGVSPEGIEGKRSVTINGGKIVVNSTDDCINTSVEDESYIVINGGLVYAHSSANDAVDSNGTIEMNGGVLIALGTGAPECGIDCDEDSRFTYKGGTIVAMGGGNQLPSGSGTTGCVLTTGAGMFMGGGMPGMFGPQRQQFGPLNDTDKGFDGFAGFNGLSEVGGQGPMLDGSMGEPPAKPEDEMTPPDFQNDDSKGFEGGFMAQGAGSNGGVMGSSSSLSQGSVLTVLDSDGNPVVVFVVPEGCVTNNVLVASDAFENSGVVCYTGNATLESADFMFADSLALGNVEVEVSEASYATINSTTTSITL